MSDQPIALPTTADFVVEFVDEMTTSIDFEVKAVRFAAAHAGKAAFRAVGSVEGIVRPRLNSLGTLQGMVKSKRARLIYNLMSNIGAKFAPYDAALGMTGIIVELAKDRRRMEALWHAPIPPEQKAPMMLLITSTAILRAVTSEVPAGIHLADIVIQKAASTLNSVCRSVCPGWKSNKIVMQRWQKRLRAFDVQITTWHDEVLDPDRIAGWSAQAGDAAYTAINAYVHFR